jgi:rod shape determining protein RodA
MAIDRRLLFNMDWVLLGVVLLLSGIGVATIHSASQGSRVGGYEMKQLYALGLGVALLFVSLTFDYRRLVDRAPLFYAVSVGILAYVLFFGPRIAGTRRWLVLAGQQIQPSEFVKLVAALLVAKLFAESKKESLGLADLVVPGSILGLLVLLIAAEPDLGTAVCLLPIFVCGAFLAGLRLKAIAGLVCFAVVVGGFAWQFAMRDYQKERIYTFLDPQKDPRGAGYQKIQSQIAVGSGGLTGKGYKQGSQSQLGYLPARHTDFIFSVLAEEMGFVGVAVVLALYLFILWRFLETAQLARDRAGAFLAAGVAAGFGFQVVYNIAMVAGLVPVKGLPLPLLSYGGSSILSSLLAVSLVMNVRMRRFAN